MILGTPTDRKSRTSVKELLANQGTDKGKWFGGLYDVLLQPQRETIRCVVEIGIGTLIPDAASSMVGWAAQHYRPGGSLRAWRNFLPAAEIHGLDVTRDTQFFDEPRIYTHLCDSRNPEHATAFLATIAQPPDLIIDDGLHDAVAQAKTLRNFFPSLREGGLYIVEDVLPQGVQPVLDEMMNIQADFHYFVAQCHPCEPWVALAIRKGT
jgi:hypothetical protein